jgi:hypothetical protein
VRYIKRQDHHHHHHHDSALALVCRALVLVFVQEGQGQSAMWCSVVKGRCVAAFAIHPQSVLA